jgi:Cu-Zn family superoxide dismutase
LTAQRSALIAAAVLTLGVSMLGVSLGPVSDVAAQPDGEDAIAVMWNLAGEEVGIVSFGRERGHVRVRADVVSLPPGFHGFHIHAVGVCDPATGFGSAGGHLNLTDDSHPAHTGDMPNLYVNGDGTASIRFLTDRMSIEDLLADGGRAVMIHAEPDNFAHIPARYGVVPDEMTMMTGDGGDRLACGVVQRP